VAFVLGSLISSPTPAPKWYQNSDKRKQEKLVEVKNVFIGIYLTTKCPKLWSFSAKQSYTK
jgi:hypothetical protein